MSALIVAIVLLAGLAALFLLGGVSLWRRRYRGGSAGALLLGLVFLLLSVAAGLVQVGTRGYRALTREEVAATVTVERLSPDEFRARFTFPDGGSRTYRMAGDQVYVDAHILKWKPIVNLLGLHTEYELDRVAGRWASLERERSGPRTVYSLAREKPFDFFHIARKVPLFDPLVDAEYGSASFAEVEEEGVFELRVSTSGLLLRRVEALPP